MLELKIAPSVYAYLLINTSSDPVLVAKDVSLMNYPDEGELLAKVAWAGVIDPTNAYLNTGPIDFNVIAFIVGHGDGDLEKIADKINNEVNHNTVKMAKEIQPVVDDKPEPHNTNTDLADRNGQRDDN